jgi:hypothetical protein
LDVAFHAERNTGRHRGCQRARRLGQGPPASPVGHNLDRRITHLPVELPGRLRRPGAVLPCAEVFALSKVTWL